MIRKFYTVIEGGGSGNTAEVDTDNQVKVVINNDPAKSGSINFFSENDAGTKTGAKYSLSPETDDDYRLRIAQDTMLDSETFTYVAQNTGKHTYANTTMTISWALGGMNTNASGITTLSTAVSFGTYAFFPLFGASNLYCEVEASLSNQPVTNTTIDFGMFLRGGANPYAPTDGAFFRLNSAGLSGVVNNNGAETTTAPFDFTYTNNKKYQFIISINEREVEFWINNVLYGKIDTPDGSGQPFASASLPFSVRHAIGAGAASGVISFQLSDYNITLGGFQFSDPLSSVGNRKYGSYQGLSGGTMGSLASMANSANPTAAVPTNTTSTVLTALGGQGWETDTLAVNTDGVIMSYQIPAATVNVQGRRLRLTGVKIDSYVQTALTGGGYNAQFALCFGHTAVSLATAEAAAAKAPRRLPLGSYSVASGLAALTQLPTIQLTLQNPVYVNPGEFIAIAKKKVGTAPSAGVIAYLITLDYGWE
jgi:hypothetical protein